MGKKSRIFKLLFVVIVENIATLRAELRRMVRIWRLPATLIALEQRCSLRLLAAAFSAELACVYSAAAAGPAILCRFVFRLLAAAVSTELTAVLSAALAGPLFRFRLTAVITELAGIYCTAGTSPASGTAGAALRSTALRSLLAAAGSLRTALLLLLTHGEEFRRAPPLTAAT